LPRHLARAQGRQTSKTTRNGPGVPWNAPATVGTSFEGGGVPESVAINGAGQAAVVYHGYSSDYLTYIEYTNVYKP
jgi:hypothetical protein